MVAYSPIAIPNIPKILSTFFNIPSSYFTFPNIIFYFIVPFLSGVYFWHSVLKYKIRIFWRSDSVNYILAFLIAFFNIAALTIFPPILLVTFSVSCGVLLAGQFTGKRILLAIATAVLIWLIYPWSMAIVSQFSLN